MKHTTTQTQQIQTLLSWADEQGFSEDIFPRSIEKLLSITELNLHSKNLNFIPQEINVLQNLTKLYLSDNNLVSIPKEIGDLKNLQTLWIQNNKIQVLPNEILNLSLLEELVAFDNRLQTLPKKIADMTSLKSLFLHRNCLDLKILEREFNSIKNEFELSVYNQNSKYTFNEVAAIFLQGSENDILIDEDDLKIIMSYEGVQLIVSAEYSGKETALNALNMAMQSELLSSTAIGTTKCVLVQFKTNPDYPIMEICEAISDFHDKFNNADMLFCSLADKNLDKNHVSVTILFAGFGYK